MRKNIYSLIQYAFAVIMIGCCFAVHSQAEELKKNEAKSKTVLITGANRGLGLELARQFAADGYYVIGTARTPEKATDLKEFASEVLPLDVTVDESIKNLAKSLEGKAIDILVNNAGYFGPTLSVGKTAELSNITRDEVLDCFAVNAAGPIFVTQGLLPNLHLSKNPKIITISSRSGIIGKGGNHANANAYGYRISKTAVNRAVRIMAADKSLSKCIVVAIAPGHNKTDMGTERAKLEPEESMKYVKGLIESLNPKHDGKFLYYNGQELSW